jgi:hypothetical protein
MAIGRRLTVRLAAVAVRSAIFCRLVVLLGATLFMAIYLVAATAQQDDLNAIQTRINELYAAGNYAAALVEAQKLEAGIRARFGTPFVPVGEGSDK